VSRPSLKLKRRKNTGTRWNEEWEKFLGNFQALCKATNSQQQKISTRLHRQLISIRRRSRISENNSHQLLTATREVISLTNVGHYIQPPIHSTRSGWIKRLERMEEEKIPSSM
jgi:hypothetical protein